MSILLLRSHSILCSALLLASFIFITFHPVLQNDFMTWDDGLLITGNPIVQEFSLRSVQRAFTSYDPELYIPLTFLSYQLDHLVWGLNPMGFHLTNLMLHTVNAILVFVLVNLLMGKSQSLIPLLVALVWAVHPLNTEAVAWASSRKDLLSGFFFLLSLCLYLRSGKPWFGSAHHRWLSAAAFLLGLLAKVSIAPLPIILLLIDWLQKRRVDRKALLEKVPFFALSILFGIIALGGKHGNTELFSEKILIGAKATMFYLGHLLWPTGLSVLYPYTQSITWSNGNLLTPLFLALGLSILAFFLRKKHPVVSFGWSFFLLMLLPSFTNFAKGHDQLRDVYFASDRYTYLPSIGLFLLFGTGLRSLLPPLSLGTFSILSPLLLLPLSFLSYQQSHVWHSTETLFQNVTKHYPDSHIAWNNLGSIALKRGDVQRAIEDYEQSLTIRPNAAAFFNLGQIALQKGLIREAMELYRRATLSRPNDTDSLLNLGVLHLRIGNATAAADLFHRAIAFDDHLAIAHFNLGLALEALRDRDGARSAYARVLELDPNDQEAREKLARLN